MTFTAYAAAGHFPWLSQGDIFSKVIVLEAVVENAAPAGRITQEPAMLVTHDCALDKKKKVNRRDVSRVDYLTFAPIRGVDTLDPKRGEGLRAQGIAGDDGPYEALYLGEVGNLGECYVSLAQPYTIPSLLLSTGLSPFTAEQTGDRADERLVANVGDTRIGALTTDGLVLLKRKWMAQWTEEVPTGIPSWRNTQN